MGPTSASNNHDEACQHLNDALSNGHDASAVTITHTHHISSPAGPALPHNIRVENFPGPDMSSFFSNVHDGLDLGHDDQQLVGPDLPNTSHGEGFADLQFNSWNGLDGVDAGNKLSHGAVLVTDHNIDQDVHGPDLGDSEVNVSDWTNEFASDQDLVNEEWWVKFMLDPLDGTI